MDLNDPMELTKELLAVREGTHDVNDRGRKGFEWVKTIAHPDVVLHQIANFYDHVKNTAGLKGHY